MKNRKIMEIVNQKLIIKEREKESEMVNGKKYTFSSSHSTIIISHKSHLISISTIITISTYQQ